MLSAHIVQPWDQQPGEDDPAYRAFIAYLRRPPPRSLVSVSSELRRPLHIVQQWCQQHIWDQRALAYDEAGGPTMAPTETDFDVLERHRRLTTALLELAEIELSKHIRDARQTTVAGAVSIPDLVKLIETTVKLDRLISGKSTENLRVMPEFDLSGLSESELLQFEALAAKATKQE